MELREWGEVELRGGEGVEPQEWEGVELRGQLLGESGVGRGLG